MQRKILDVVPRNKPSRSPEKLVAPKPIPAQSVPVPVQKQEKPQKSILSKVGKIFGAFLIIAIGAYLAIDYYASAQITFSRKTENVALSLNLTASPGAGADLTYKVMTLSKDASTTVSAATEELVQSRATGTVVIYNAYSNKPYRLIKNTRLESASGLIFKISDTVVVPGKSVSGGGSVPGSVTAEIFADSVGPAYNLGLTDFTLPGFKGSPEYSGIYARSKTALAGGWDGKKNVASGEDMSKAVARLESQTSAELTTEALGEIPDGYLIPKGAYVVSYDLPLTTNASDGVTLSLHATLRAAIFSQADISKIISARSVRKIPDPTQVTGLDSLELVPAGDLLSELASSSVLSFELKGSPVIAAVIDSGSLAAKLAGTERSQLEAILGNYPGISNADVRILPFWKTNFPTDPQKIKIIVQ